ncbi:hypothetical protein NPL7_00975 [Metamycoplasma hyosynoviae]|nr:hypothetical protein NPL3_01725 [Metamycoplasma hyosynoviae]KDE42364.1 hypothetical protein NPL7_00975 [Metamycoplasma hyosynoviae]KDE44140.1 hypothetical protein NPL5_00095 [Metamycoplasma hyosynoviae]
MYLNAIIKFVFYIILIMETQNTQPNLQNPNNTNPTNPNPQVTILKRSKKTLIRETAILSTVIFIFSIIFVTILLASAGAAVSGSNNGLWAGIGILGIFTIAAISISIAAFIVTIIMLVRTHAIKELRGLWITYLILFLVSNTLGLIQLFLKNGSTGRTMFSIVTTIASLTSLVIIWIMYGKSKTIKEIEQVNNEKQEADNSIFQ